jgi:hypothetical protein
MISAWQWELLIKSERLSPGSALDVVDAGFTIGAELMHG